MFRVVNVYANLDDFDEVVEELVVHPGNVDFELDCAVEFGV